MGTIVGFGAFTSGLRDVSLYLRHAHPQGSLPNHHDAWAPVLGPGDEAYESQWRPEVASLPDPPELDYLKDPEDYLRVRNYWVDDPRWKVPMTGSSCSGASRRKSEVCSPSLVAPPTLGRRLRIPRGWCTQWMVASPLRKWHEL